MNSNSSQKVGIITGGSSGIGQATARFFAQRGATVIISSHNALLGEQTATQINEEGGMADFFFADVSNGENVQQLIQFVLEKYGRLDFAFNNAGITGKMAPLADLEEGDFDEAIAVNLKSVWLCMKYEIQAMLRGGGGAIVNNSSISGLVGAPGGSLYSACKHGILGFTKSAAVEYAKSNIRINAVCPGPFYTKMLQAVIGNNTKTEADYEQKKQQFLSDIPVGRFGDLAEIAAAVVWLCSDEASFVIGQSLVVDGGVTIV